MDEADGNIVHVFHTPTAVCYTYASYASYEERPRRVLKLVRRDEFLDHIQKLMYKNEIQEEKGGEEAARESKEPEASIMIKALLDAAKYILTAPEIQREIWWDKLEFDQEIISTLQSNNEVKTLINVLKCADALQDNINFKENLYGMYLSKMDMSTTFIKLKGEDGAEKGVARLDKLPVAERSRRAQPQVSWLRDFFKFLHYEPIDTKTKHQLQLPGPFWASATRSPLFYFTENLRYMFTETRDGQIEKFAQEKIKDKMAKFWFYVGDLATPAGFFGPVSVTSYLGYPYLDPLGRPQYKLFDDRTGVYVLWDAEGKVIKEQRVT